MPDDAAPQVVALREAEAAGHFRLSHFRPLRGFAAVSAGGGAGRLDLYVENLRPLTERKPPGAFFYEAWLVGESGRSLRSAGAFNTDAYGQGRAFWTGDLPFPAPEAVLVTAQPLDPDQGPAMPVLAARLATSTPLAEPVSQQPATQREAAPPPAGGEAEPAPVATLAPPQPSGGPPPGCVALETARLDLSPQHPTCSRAAGNATLEFPAGAVLVTLRGMPAPWTVGRDPATGRELGSFRVWLSSSHSKETHALGACRKVWEDTFRLQVSGGVPLKRFDTLFVTAEERSGGDAPRGPTLLSARYAWYERAK